MLPTTRKNLREERERIGAEYPMAIAMALKEEMGGSRNSIKKLARWTGASERTVQNWLGGVRGPSGPHLVALARHSPAVHFAYLSMTGRIDGSASDINAGVALLREALNLLTARRLS
ncbi:hypothetical protein DIE02_29515 [Burkholderia sp. Bp8991]|nr:hypothetical protein DIE02_29515 [Burkholderia sp. Bp8991]